MTDYQFQAIIKMVLQMAKKSNSVEEVVEALKSLLAGDEEK